MKKRYQLLTAACVATSLALLSVNMAGAQNAVPQGVAPNAIPGGMATDPTLRGTTMTETDATLPAGITAKDINSDKAIEKAFKAVAEDAMSKSGFDNIVDRLVDQDRVRINKSLTSGHSLGSVKGDKNKQFADLVTTIENDWKAKYNRKFDLDVAKAYNTDFFHIQTGEVTDATQLIGKWPVDAGLMPNTAEGAGKVTQADADEARRRAFGGDVNLEKGRNVAIVHIMSSKEFNGLNASLIHEAGGWKFDVPNTLTADQLYDNVVKNLTYLDQRKDQWPADVNDAYRSFTRAITSALYDVTLPRQPGMASNF